MSDIYQLRPLLIRAQGGDASALAQLVEKLRPWIRQQAAIQFGDTNPPAFDASDIAQSVCLTFHRKFSQFRGNSAPQLLAWLGRITRNEVCTKARRGFPAPIATGSSVLSGLVDHNRTAADEVDRDEQAVAMASAMEKLPDVQRELIELRFFRQLSFAQIAQLTGRTSGALKVACLRAIKRLRSELEHGSDS